MGLTSWVTAPLCFLNIGRNFSASSPSPPPHPRPPADKRTAWRLETEACLFLSWVNICRLRKPERNGGVEKLPTRMTKLRSEPLSPQPDSRERWEIEAAQTPVSAGQGSNANNGVCTAAARLTQGIKISCNNAKECN